MNMMSDLGTLIGLAIDVVLWTTLYTWYKRINRYADEIKKAPNFKPDEKLIEALHASGTGNLKYACVQGEVMPVGRTVTSNYQTGQVGVIQHIKITEYKGQRVQGSWTDSKNTITKNMDSVPFVLTQGIGNVDTKGPQLLITEVGEANFLMNELTVTHDEFTKKESNFLSHAVDLMFGDVTKGYHHTEEMLLTNTTLLGIGEIVLIDGQLQLRPPKYGSMYILTKLSKAEVIKTLEHKSFWIKLLTIGTGLMGTGLLIYLLRKRFKIWLEKRSRQKLIVHVHQERERRLQQGAEINMAANTCVICLQNPREIVLLNCGHICLCTDCITAMSTPLQCPVCRQSVIRYITTYNP